MALVDGERVTPLAPAEDHKTIFDGDRGPMTGGMGVVSPTPVMSDSTVARAVREVLEPTARGLVAEGRPFRGLLYAGLMVTADGPRVLEFNCRFGDPETQVLMARLDDDLGALLHAVATGRAARARALLAARGGLRGAGRGRLSRRLRRAACRSPGSTRPRALDGRHGLPRRHARARASASSPPAVACSA